jgi:cyclic beta-1,2-glucan synthetase
MLGDSEDKSLKDKKYSSHKKIDVKKIMTDRLDENFEDIKKAYDKLTQYSDKKKHLPKASEWILNDFYLVELRYIGIKLELKKEKKIVLNITVY